MAATNKSLAQMGSFLSASAAGDAILKISERSGCRHERAPTRAQVPSVQPCQFQGIMVAF